MTEELAFTPLTEDELQSLAWIATVATRIAIPVAHLHKLLDAGYITESVIGPVLTDFGEYILGRDVDVRRCSPQEDALPGQKWR
jgi:hypothetical protein